MIAKRKNGVLGEMLFDEELGTVTALPAVTNVIDSVGDLIAPGAIGRSLNSLWPKCVDGHDFSKPIGRVLDAEELLPRDPRLPSDLLLIDAGALRVRVQLNLETRAGAEAYSNLRFFGDEAGWSITYSVPRGGESADAAAGCNVISDLTILTTDPVLFGANSLARTLSLKAAERHRVARTEPEGSVLGSLWREGWGDSVLRLEADLVRSLVAIDIAAS